MEAVERAKQKELRLEQQLADARTQRLFAELRAAKEEAQKEWHKMFVAPGCFVCKHRRNAQTGQIIEFLDQ